MFIHFPKGAALIGVAACLLASPVWAVSYDVESVAFPGALGTESVAINNRGQILGDYQDAAGAWTTYLYDHGTYKTIPLPDYFATAPMGLSDFGDVLFGALPSAESGWKSFLVRCGARELWNPVTCAGNPGNYQEITYPGAYSTLANGVNGRGQVVGQYSTTSAGIYHGFILENGVYTAVDFPHDQAAGPVYATVLYAVNNLGLAVGSYLVYDPADPDSSAWHAFSYYRGKYINLTLPSGTVNADAVGVNDLGQITVSTLTATGKYETWVIWMTMLNKVESKAALTAYGINNSGQIVGCQNGAQVKGFVAAPHVGRK